MRPRNEKILLIDYDKLASYLTDGEIKKLEQVLGKLDINHKRASLEYSSPSIEKSDPKKYKTELSKYCLKITADLHTYLIKNSQIPQQIRIEPEGKKSLDSIKSEEISMAFNWAVNYLRYQGYRQYVFYRDHTSMQFLPVADSGEIVDVNAKVSRLYYLFWQDPYTLNTLSPIQECKPNNTPLHFQYETTWINIDELNKNTEHRLFKTLQKTGCISEVVSSHIEYVKKFKMTVSDCAFCRENVIRNQLIMDCGSLLILANYAPTTESELRFLIISTRHIEDWSELDSAAQSYLPYLVTSLSRSIQYHGKRTKDEIVSYVQNGVQTGQTVPHSHMHVLTKPVRPAFFTHILSQGVGLPWDALSKDKMHAMRDQFAPLTYQELTLKAPIPKQIFLSRSMLFFYDKLINDAARESSATCGVTYKLN